MTTSFDRLRTERTVVLTRFRRDGTGVPTAVHVAVEGDHAYVRTWSTSGKAKRHRRDPHLRIAPSTIRGTPTGPASGAVARVLDGDEAAAAFQRLARKYPVLQGRLVPWAHRLRGYTTVFYELTESPPETPT